MKNIIPFTQHDLEKVLQLRPNETRLGQQFALPTEALSPAYLKQLRSQGVRFVLLGAGEDTGPRANLGRAGASTAFEACLQSLVNLQSNRFFDGAELLLLGHIDFDDLHAPQQASVSQLRERVALMDQRLIEAVTPIIAAGLEPIVIGGGHNNAFGLLMSVKGALGKAAAAVNLDPHSDFRLREGRHSGNGFSYAAANNALGFYHVLGLHELKNNESTLEQLQAFGSSWHSLQDIWVRGKITLDEALMAIGKAVNSTDLPVAVELDLDAISNMPASAMTIAGVPLMDAAKYVSYIASHCQCAYLHLAEAAPSCHSGGEQAGMRDVGQALSELIYAYVSGRSS